MNNTTVAMYNSETIDDVRFVNWKQHRLMFLQQYAKGQTEPP